MTLPDDPETPLPSDPGTPLPADPETPLLSAEPSQPETRPEADASIAEVPAPAVIASAVTGSPAITAPAAPARPELLNRQEPVYRDCRGYRLRLDPPDLARLRELAGSRGKSDDELGEAFFDGLADRLAASLADDVPAPAEIRVVVDPYSRQAFLALENRIRGILSF